jgi:acyl carrier protein
MAVFDQLRDTIAAILKVPVAKITENTKNEDLAAWDSLGHVNLMIAVEQTFDVTLDVEDFPRLNSVPAILEYLKAQGIA